MKLQHIDMVMLDKDIPPMLDKWIKESMPIDIIVRRGEGERGQMRVCFEFRGSSQSDILAKIEAMEKLLSK